MLPHLLAALLACPSSPSGEEATPVTSSGGGPDQPVERPVVPALGEGWRTEESAMIAATMQAIAACRAGPVGSLHADEAESAPLPIEPDTLEATCGPAGDLYDTWAPRVGGRTRSGDILLRHLARLGAEVDYVERALHDEAGSERSNAVVHISDALADAEAGATHAAEGLSRWEITVRLDAPAWARSVAGDEHEIGGLRSLFQQLAFTQGATMELVRLRMLDAGVRMALRQVAARGDALARDPAADQASRLAYQEAATRAATAYADILEAYRSGAVDSLVAVRAQEETADATDATWRAAWQAEQARIESR